MSLFPSSNREPSIICNFKRSSLLYLVILDNRRPLSHPHNDIFGSPLKVIYDTDLGREEEAVSPWVKVSAVELSPGSCEEAAGRPLPVLIRASWASARCSVVSDSL